MVLVYCYGRIVWTLSRRLDSHSDKITNQPDTFQIARRNVTQTFLLVSICFVVCWSSEQVYYLLFNLGYDADFNGTFFKFSVVMAFGNCTINPFIYLLKYKDYQIALRHCFTCKIHKSFNDKDINSISRTQGNSITKQRTASEAM